MSAIERVAPAPLSKREVDWIEGLAKRYARSPLCPSWAKNKPDKAAIVLFTAHSLGIDVTNVAALENFHEIDGKLSPSAHLYAGLAHAGGHEMELREYGPEQAVVEFRRHGSERWQRITFTIDMARQAGLLDEWVEHKVPDGSWPDGNTKYRIEKFVLGSATKPPAWVDKEIEEGHIKRRDNWHRYPADMLLARAAKRAAKFVAPDAVLGLTVALGDEGAEDEGLPSTAPLRSQQPAPRLPRDEADDDIEDAELVEDEPSEPNRPNPHAKAVHIAAHEAGLSDEALDAILHDHTGGVSARGVTRDNVRGILAAIQATKAKA